MIRLSYSVDEPVAFPDPLDELAVAISENFAVEANVPASVSTKPP